MFRFRYRKIRCVLASAALCAALCAGCGDRRLEDELAFRKIGISSLESGDYEGALAAFESALKQYAGKITATEIDICYYKVAAQSAGGDLQGALETCEAILGYDGRDGKAAYLKGCILLQTGDTQKALAAFEDAVKYEKESPEICIGIYENLSAYNLTSEGEDYLNRVFESKGDSAEKSALRGKAYYLLGEYENAVKELEAAIDRESAEANLTLAQVYDAMGDTAGSAKYYQAYLASGAADSGTMYTLAAAEMEKGNYEAALTYVEQGLAMEHVPNKKALLHSEVICSEQTGDFARAFRAVQEYTSLYPEDEAAKREAVFLKYRQPDAAAGEASPEGASSEGESSPAGESGTEQGAIIPAGTEQGTAQPPASTGP